MTQTVFIDGAAGTTGLEIAERLAGRSEFALIALPEAERKDAARRAEALDFIAAMSKCGPVDQPQVFTSTPSTPSRAA